MDAWDGPESKATSKTIKKGARMCYMDASLDETVSAWDECTTNETFDTYDWKIGVGKLFKSQQLALFHSPLGVDEEKEDKEDLVASDIYENE